MVETDVLIVGAGPVGLIAALRLSQMSIGFILCEAESELPADLRASTFHPPTLDMLATLGIADALIAEGLISPTWQIRIHETNERAEFDLSLLAGETDHPYRLQCEQFRLCRLALARLAEIGADIRLGARVTSVEDRGDHVVTKVRGEAGEYAVRARFVIGADGARSIVRHAINPAFEGVTYPETTILVTTEFRFEDRLSSLSNVNYVWWREGTFSLLRLRHIWRCSLYPDRGETIDDALTPKSIERKLQKIVAKDSPFDVDEVRAYRVHMRIAEQFRKGRLLIAGDAAHLNSPSGGMGMNGGIHDAFMLTKAIERSLDVADSAALDRYSTARRRIAEQEILHQADRNRSRMQEADAAKRRAMFDELKRTAETPALARDYLLKSSMIAGLRLAEAQE